MRVTVPHPEYDCALGLDEALQDGQVLRVAFKDWCHSAHDLLDGLLEFRLVGVSLQDFVPHFLHGAEVLPSGKEGEMSHARDAVADHCLQ